MTVLYELNEIKELVNNDKHFKYKNIVNFNCESIEKSLKALEIIKKKCLTNCNLALVKDNLNYQNYCKEFEYFLNKYNESPNGFEITKEDLLTEEEFNTLKEVLE